MAAYSMPWTLFEKLPEIYGPTERADDRHRPWPAPKNPWLMYQRWENLAFLHWEVPAEKLREALPEKLRHYLDTFKGNAYVGITPFQLRDLRMRGLPPVPFVSNFPEINLRTYLSIDGKAGVYFFSLDAGSGLAALAARVGLSMNYYPADIEIHPREKKFLVTMKRSTDPAIRFSAEYEPVRSSARAADTSLAYWLSERYCLYALCPDETISRIEIHHAQWPLADARATVKVNSLAEPFGLDLSENVPLVHYAKELEVMFWAPEKVKF